MEMSRCVWNGAQQMKNATTTATAIYSQQISHKLTSKLFTFAILINN